MYDFVIVGAGLYGSTFAREMTDRGKKCLIIDSRNHIAGNCYTEDKEGIHVHKYGAHIFHTNDEFIWKYVQRFAEFNNYKNSPRVRYKDKLYSFPINLLTLYQIYGVLTPGEAQKKLEEVRVNIEDPANLEEWILSQVGEEIYNIFIKGYTTKQWMKDPKDLPSFIIKRLPIRLNFDDNYFFDKFQGIPIGGYTSLFNNLLKGIEVRLNTNYFDNKDYFDSLGQKVVFTGRIDEFFNYCYGELEYRTLRFDHSKLPIEDYQGNAVVNYTDIEVPYTRIIEHKHFEFGKQPFTFITKEYPEQWQKDSVPYYPINDERNTKIFNQYKELSKKNSKYIFGGRLADYRYYDMHQVIGSALAKVRKLDGESQ
jgi:UDP-galactopyranose mutase